MLFFLWVRERRLQARNEVSGNPPGKPSLSHSKDTRLAYDRISIAQPLRLDVSYQAQQQGDIPKVIGTTAPSVAHADGVIEPAEKHLLVQCDEDEGEEKRQMCSMLLDRSSGKFEASCCSWNTWAFSSTIWDLL